MSIPQNFTVIDLETTGPITEQNHVIDIGIVRVENGKIVKTYETLVRPPISVPSSITRLTGIQDEDLISAPTFKEVADEVEELFQGAVFTAHNAPFDYGFLTLEFIRLGRRFTKPVLCTKNLAHKVLPELPKLGLDALMEHFQISADTRHRAFPDAEITAKVLLELFKIEGAEKHLGQVLIPENKAGLSIPPNSFFDHLPEASGVYRFLSSKGKILYVGSSTNIRLRALIHFLAQIESKKEEELCAETAKVDFSATSTELDALIEEAREVREERPLHNLLMKRWYPGSYLWVTQEDYPQMYIESEPSDQESIRSYGPFPLRKMLEKLIDYAKPEFHLCDFRTWHSKHPTGRFPGRRACASARSRRCLEACLGKISPDVYQGYVDQAIQFITTPLKDASLENASFLQILKKGKATQGPGGWKVKRILVRLLKEDEVTSLPGDDFFLVEESGAAPDQIHKKSVYLIHKGLLQKSWVLEKEAHCETLHEEIAELVKQPVSRKKDEEIIERLVIKSYLSQPRVGRTVIPLNLLAARNLNK